MSATGVTSLDHIVHETNVWLRDVQEEIHLETRQEAYNALRAVLHTHAAGTPTKGRIATISWTTYGRSCRASFLLTRSMSHAASSKFCGNTLIPASSRR